MAERVRRCPLSGAAAFESVFRNGLRRDGDYVQLIALQTDRRCSRTGFVIGRKALPLAVDRNRVRRMLRVVLRQAEPSLAGLDVVVRLKRRAARGEFPLIVAEAKRLLAALPTPRRPA